MPRSASTGTDQASTPPAPGGTTSETEGIRLSTHDDATESAHRSSADRHDFFTNRSAYPVKTELRGRPLCFRLRVVSEEGGGLEESLSTIVRLSALVQIRFCQRRGSRLP